MKPIEAPLYNPHKGAQQDERNENVVLLSCDESGEHKKTVVNRHVNSGDSEFLVTTWGLIYIDTKPYWSVVQNNVMTFDEIKTLAKLMGE